MALVKLLATAPEELPPDPKAFRGSDLVVVLPTLNEEDGVPVTYEGIPLKRLLDKGRRVRLLVVDGGSTDRTVAVAASLGIPVLRQQGKGKGQAVRQALGWLRESGVRYAVVMDADSTYPGDMVGAVLDLLEAGSHIVVGVREPKRSRPESVRDFVHRVGNAVLNFAGGQVSGRPILDLCSGFWGLDLSTGLDQVLQSNGFDVEAELFLKAYRGGYVVTQIPIRYGPRIGTPKLRAAQDGARILSTILRAVSFPRANQVREPPRPIPFLRALLSVCVVQGSDSLVVWADPSRREEARQLVRAIRHSDVSPQLRANGAGAHSSTSLSWGARTLASERGPLFVSFYPVEPAEGLTHDSGLEVYLPGPNRTVRLELAPEARGLPLARSGAFAGPQYLRVGMPESGARSPLSNFQFLRVSLGAGGVDRDLTFFAANGLTASVVESTRRASVALPPTDLPVQQPS